MIPRVPVRREPLHHPLSPPDPAASPASCARGDRRSASRRRARR